MSPIVRSWITPFASLALAVLAAASPGEAHAQSTDLEVGPWLGWAAGVQWVEGASRESVVLNTGLDATLTAMMFGSFELRAGSWLAFNVPADRLASGEGGWTFILTDRRHASWGTFGLRAGLGYGGDRETHVVATLWGGVRYVPARARQGGLGLVSKATGIRIVATARRIVDPIEVPSLTFGVEFEPDYLLPPYSLSKWIGEH